MCFLKTKQIVVVKGASVSTYLTSTFVGAFAQYDLSPLSIIASIIVLCGCSRNRTALTIVTDTTTTQLHNIYTYYYSLLLF